MTAFLQEEPLIPAGPVQALIRRRIAEGVIGSDEVASQLRLSWAGYRTFMGSPRISLWAADHIVTKLDCHLALLYPELYVDELEAAS
jgi:hypothetical protein